MIKKVRSLTMQTKMILLICLVVFLALFVAHLLITRTVEDDIRKEAALKANPAQAKAMKELQKNNPEEFTKLQVKQIKERLGLKE